MSCKPSWGTHSPTKHRAGQLPSADIPLWRLLGKLVAIRITATVRLLRRSRKARHRAAVGLAAVLLVVGMVHVCVRLPSSASAAPILTTRASPPDGQKLIESEASGGDAGRQDLDSVLRLGGRSRSSFAGASGPDGFGAVRGPGSASAGGTAGLGAPGGSGADGGAASIVDQLRHRGEGEAGYAEQLRRRAAELSVEISRFKERAVPQSKQERLQMAARVLSTQLTALKARAGALTLGARDSAFDQAAAGGAAGGAEGAAGGAAADGLAATGGGGRRGLPAQGPSGVATPAAGPCGADRHPDFRIGMVLPWVDGGVDGTRHTPAWFPHLAATAAHSSLLVDWVILHEGSLALPPAARPPNVFLFDVQPGGIARLFAARLSGALGLATDEARALEQRMLLMFGKWPRLVAEYKPAYGHIFSRWLGNYTHWGYTDFDTIVGQLPRFIERSELTEHHIVTYSFGDTEAVYLRGQWTVHRNTPGVNRLWRQCSHLSDGLLHELSLKVAHLRKMEAAGKANYHKRFLSAEGCYSYKAAHTRTVRIKVRGSKPPL